MVRHDPKETNCPYTVMTAVERLGDKQHWIHKNMGPVRSFFFVRVGTSYDGMSFHFSDPTLATAFMLVWGR